MMNILKKLARAGLFSAFLLTLSSCATTDSGGGKIPWTTTADGIPIGRWTTVIKAPLPELKISQATNTIILRPDGTGIRLTTTHYQLKPGRSLTVGKFKGQHGLKWTDQKTVGTIKRIGNKLFFYGDPNAKETLVEGSPPGYTLDDYRNFGGASTDMTSGAETGVTIFEIVGKDLVMTNSDEGNRWLYKWSGR